jgi:acetylornithine deacetylase/succinyl-diaminopimelate desuccinylase-like protein
LIEALHRIAAHQTPLTVEPVVQRFYADIAATEADPERRERLKDLDTSLKDPAFAAQFTKDRWDSAVVRNTISISMLEGSNKINVIPAVASAQLDVRLLPSQDSQIFINELHALIADDSIKIEPILSFVSSSSPTEGPFFDVLTEVVSSFHPGAKVTTPLLTGFTDCHYFREQGIPCYGFMPFKLTDNDFAGIHGHDERISLDNVKLGTQLMYEIVHRMATR